MRIRWTQNGDRWQACQLFDQAQDDIRCDVWRIRVLVNVT
jgi:hypothetical protein